MLHKFIHISQVQKSVCIKSMSDISNIDEWIKIALSSNYGEEPICWQAVEKVVGGSSSWNGPAKVAAHSTPYYSRVETLFLSASPSFTSFSRSIELWKNWPNMKALLCVYNFLSWAITIPLVVWARQQSSVYREICMFTVKTFWLCFLWGRAACLIARHPASISPT